MISPPGWSEPGQTPKLREITVVLHDVLLGARRQRGGSEGLPQAIITEPGEWVRCSTPNGTGYIAICTPAFRPETMQRDAAS